MKIFVISDTHFYHKNIIKYCDRGFKSYQEMNSCLIEKWNSKVSKEDIVLHLGDFSLFGNEKAKTIRKQLNGTIILIRGNHDYKLTEDCGFLIISGNLRIENTIFSHKPLPLEELPEGCVNVFGHIHNREVFDSTRQINISVEKTNYEPVELENVYKLLTKTARIK